MLLTSLESMTSMKTKKARFPRYKPDNGPLTRRQIEAIQRLQPLGRMKAKESLF